MNAAKKAYETVSHIDEEERNRLLLEQLPQVRYIARRIHDRLPQSVCVEDLVHAGVDQVFDADALRQAVVNAPGDVANLGELFEQQAIALFFVDMTNCFVGFFGSIHNLFLRSEEHTSVLQS